MSMKMAPGTPEPSRDCFVCYGGRCIGGTGCPKTSKGLRFFSSPKCQIVASLVYLAVLVVLWWVAE